MTASRVDSWLSHDPAHSALPLDRLTAAALGYLALPVFLFCGGWLKPLYAVPACLLLGAALWAAFRPADLARRPPLPAAILALAALAGFGWSLFGGAGHAFYANADWLLRDAVLQDLVRTPWPPSYGEEAGHAMILRTALAYYLPAAFLGWLTTPGLADLLLYAWTGAGAALFLMMLPLPAQPLAAALALVIAILFSGMDALGVLLLAHHLPGGAVQLEWWAHPLQYSSQTTQLFWVPNHALPAWIAAALFYRHWRTPEFGPAFVLLCALLPLWTPFAALGIAPFAVLLAADRLRLGAGLRLPLLVAIPAALLVALELRYLGLGFVQLDANTPAEVSFEPGASWGKYLRFVLLEFALLAAVLYPLLRHSRALWAVAVAVLAVLPLFNFGPANDVVMRASIPSLALLAILCIRALDEARAVAHGAALRASLLVMLAVGAITPAYEFWRAVLKPRWMPSMERTLLDASKGQMAPNYFARLDRDDVKALLKPPTRVLPRTRTQ